MFCRRVSVSLQLPDGGTGGGDERKLDCALDSLSFSFILKLSLLLMILNLQAFLWSDLSFFDEVDVEDRVSMPVEEEEGECFFLFFILKDINLKR